MRTRKFISMLMLPAAFVACTNEDIYNDDFAANVEDQLVKDLMFNVSLDESVASRGVYAGDKDGNIFQNFYLEPEFYTAVEGSHQIGDLKLTSIEGFAGDMLGFSLVNGANAITNMPFYIAGYGSTKGTDEDAKNVIYAFDTDNDLYKLVDSNDENYVVEDFSKDLYEASIAEIKKLEANKPLTAEALDVRKGIVRNNAGVMSGNYIAYYPYNGDFTEPGGVPVVKLDYLPVYETSLATTQADAIKAANFYDKLFAISQTTNTVDGKTKSGNVSLLPRTGAVFFKIYNSGDADNKNKDVKIKRITVTAQEDAADDDFVLEGYVPMNDLSSIVATESSALIGAQFPATKVATGWEKEADDNQEQWVMVPCYPVSGKSVKLEVYDNAGRVAVINKTSVPGLGKSVTYTVDMKDLTFVETVRKVFTDTDFEDEIKTDGTLLLMGDITVKNTVTISTDLIINGAHKLTLKDATISGELTTGTGVDLVLEKGSSTNKLTLDKLTIPTGSEITLGGTAEKNISIATVENKGKLTIATASKAVNGVTTYTQSISFTTLNNAKEAVLSIEGALTATTINNDAQATISVKAPLTATTINNAAAVTTTPKYKAGVIEVTASTSAANVVNKGELTWNSTEDMNLVLTNEGTFKISSACAVVGAIVNEGEISVGNNVKFSDTTVTNNGTVNTEDKAIVTLIGTTSFVNNGTVKDNGTFSGLSRLTNAEGAKVIRKVTALTNLNAALAEDKLTAINIADDIVGEEGYEIETTKTIILNANLTLPVDNGEKSTISNIEFASDATLVGNVTADAIAVNANGTIGATSNVTVNGTITIAEDMKLTGSDNSYTICNDIAGKGSVTGTIYVK